MDSIDNNDEDNISENDNNDVIDFDNNDVVDDVTKINKSDLNDADLEDENCIGFNNCQLKLNDVTHNCKNEFNCQAQEECIPCSTVLNSDVIGRGHAENCGKLDM